MRWRSLRRCRTSVVLDVDRRAAQMGGILTVSAYPGKVGAVLMSNGTRRLGDARDPCEPSHGFCRSDSRIRTERVGYSNPAHEPDAPRCDAPSPDRCGRYRADEPRESTTRRTEKGRDRGPGVDHVRVAHIANARTTSVDVLRSHRSLRSRHPRQLIRERIRSPHLAPPRRPRVAHHQTHPESRNPPIGEDDGCRRRREDCRDRGAPQGHGQQRRAHHLR